MRKVIIAVLLLAGTMFSQATNMGPIRTSSINGVCNLPMWALGSTTGGIAEAITGGCTELYNPSYSNLNLTTSVTISTGAVTLENDGIITVNHLLDAFVITGQNFVYKGLGTITIGTATSRGTSAIFNQQTQIAHYYYPHIVGNGSSANNGRFFTSTGSGSGAGAAWFIVPYIQAGTTWQDAIYISNKTGSSTAASFFSIAPALNGVFLNSMITLDGFIDTFIVDGGGGDGLVGTTGNCVQVINTQPNANGAPRWVHFNGTLVECGGNAGKTALQLDAVRNFSYFGYIAASKVAVATGASVQGVNVSDTVFTNIGNQAVTIAQTAPDYGDIILANNYFDDTANSADATYNTIDFNCTSAMRVTLSGNHWRNANSLNKPNNGIGVNNAGCDGYKIIDNSFFPATFRVGYISDLGTGLMRVIRGNNDGSLIDSSASTRLLINNASFHYWSTVPGGVLTDVLAVTPNAGNANNSFTKLVGQLETTNVIFPGALDVGISRGAAAQVNIGNGTAGDASGTIAVGGVKVGANGTLYTQFQMKNGVAGCATAASVGATCTTVVTWPATFADSGYIVSCIGSGLTSGVPLNGGLTARSTTTVTFQTVAGTAAAAQYTTIECTGWHP